MNPHDRLQALIAFALKEGWKIIRTPDGFLKIVKPESPPHSLSSGDDHG
jgi:hypothetical protein